MTRNGRWPWLAPPLVLAVSATAGDHLDVVSAVVAGLVVMGLVARCPGRALMVWITALPFDLYGSAALYRLGVPASTLAALRFWPEAFVAGLAIAAVFHFWRRRPRLDALDLSALGFVALASLYLFLPKVFLSAPVGTSLSFYARELGWRTDVIFVVAFLVARRLPVDRRLVERASTRVAALGAVIAALGLFEFVAPGTWNRFAAGWLQVPTYEQNVLRALPIGSTLTSVEVWGSLGGHRFVRVGSVLDYESLGFYLVIALGVATAYTLRGTAPSWMRWSVPLLAVGLFVTQTRSALLAGGVAVAVAWWTSRRSHPAVDHRLASALGVVALVAVGLFILSGTGSRLAGDQVSDTGHTDSIHQGLQALFDYPQGRGLATSGPQYKRSALSTAGLITGYPGPATGILVTDDEWLAVGTEMGFLGLALFVAMAVLVVRRLGGPGRWGGVGSAAGGGGGSVAALGLRDGFVGILIGGTFLQPFTNDAVSLTLFALVGLALGAGMGSVVGSGAADAATERLRLSSVTTR